MTTDEIIDTGHKAGTLFITQFGVASVTTEWLENFAALIATAKDVKHQQTLALQQRAYEREIEIEVEAEREACARVCEDIEEAYQRQESMRHPALRTDAETGSGECADAIRARSNT